MEELIKRAEEGDDRAQYQLALAFYNGNGIKQSNREAYKWYQLSAEQGDKEAIAKVNALMKLLKNNDKKNSLFEKFLNKR